MAKWTKVNYDELALGDNVRLKRTHRDGTVVIYKGEITRLCDLNNPYDRMTVGTVDIYKNRFSDWTIYLKQKLPKHGDVVEYTTNFWDKSKKYIGVFSRTKNGYSLGSTLLDPESEPVMYSAPKEFRTAISTWRVLCNVADGA